MATLIRADPLPDQSPNIVYLRILMTGDYNVGKTTLMQAFWTKQHVMKQELEPNGVMECSGLETNGNGNRNCSRLELNGDNTISGLESNGNVNGSSTSWSYVKELDTCRPIGWKLSIVAREKRRILQISDTAG